MQTQTDTRKKGNLQFCKKAKLRHLSPSVVNAGVLLTCLGLGFFQFRYSTVYEMGVDVLRAKLFSGNRLISISIPVLQTGDFDFAGPACNPCCLHKL